MSRIKFSILLFGMAILSLSLAHCGSSGITPVGTPMSTVATVDGQVDQATVAVAPSEAPPNLQTLFDRGLDFYNNGQFDEAIQSFKEVLERDPSHLNARSNLGAAYFRQGNLQTALREFQLAHSQAEDDAEILYNLGAVKLGLGDSEGALEDFQTAQQLSPELADVYIGIGNVHLLNGENEAGLQDLKKAIELAPDADWRPIIERQIEDVEQKVKATEGD